MAKVKSLSEALIYALQSVGNDDLKTFKQFLKESALLGKFKGIPKDKLQTENRAEIVEAMMDNFGIFTISVMKTILEALPEKVALQKLCTEYPYDPEAIITSCKEKVQSELIRKFQFLDQGLSKTRLEDICTEVSMVEAGSWQINEEHEVRQVERESKTSTQGRPIEVQKMFTTGAGDPVRTVLTKGVAGVGKTVLTQKFSLDWAEGKAHQDFQLLFHLSFRDLNNRRGTDFSLMELLHNCFKESNELFSLQYLKVLFILDGLDECTPPLKFKGTQAITDPSKSASLEELLVNLIRGDLLPFAQVWITTRPAAANQIPPECSMVTEVKGFDNKQKEQYFRKRFKDQQQATAVFSHIKSIRSLFIMCYIPMFCWILSTVFKEMMKLTEKLELPKTLTEMYVHFLVLQAKLKNSRYDGGSGADLHWTEETKKMVWSLGKLAFKQLLKGKLIFYKSDLRESDLDAAEVARYSGVFTEIFREESGLYQNKVYCFIHLTVQEFLAALHVHQTFFSSGMNLLSKSHSFDTESFYRSAVDQALQSPNGHLDLFLRFLLGLSLPANQELLRDLLTYTERVALPHTSNQSTVSHIHKKMDMESVSAERSLNLLHCLNELKNNDSLQETMQQFMRENGYSDISLSPAQWATVSYLLLSQDSDLKEFDLRKYHASKKAFRGLLPVIKASTQVTLSGCELSSVSCDLLRSVLSSSSLTLLDLSNNDLEDKGVELLCEVLKSAPCKLETLRLSGCLVSARGAASLASALSSASSHLKELDLRYNHPGPAAKSLTDLLSSHRSLHTVRLDHAGEQWMVKGLRKYSCEFVLDVNTAHRCLLVSEDQLSVTRGEGAQPYPPHQDRFSEQPQVLSSRGLSGRCYWEAEWHRGGVDVAVSRGDRGEGGERRFGDCDGSWSLRVEEGQCSVVHGGRVEKVWFGTQDLLLSEASGTVAVLLDSEAGTLSFYHVLHDRSLFHIHTVFPRVSEPLSSEPLVSESLSPEPLLFPGFGLRGAGSGVTVRKTGGRKRPLED